MIPYIAALVLLLILFARPREFRWSEGFCGFKEIKFRLFGGRYMHLVFVTISLVHFGVQCGHTPKFKWWQFFSLLPNGPDAGQHRRILDLNCAPPSSGTRIWLYARGVHTIGHVDIYVNRSISYAPPESKTGFGITIFPLSWKLGLWRREKKSLFAFGPLRFTIHRTQGAWKVA